MCVCLYVKIIKSTRAYKTRVRSRGWRNSAANVKPRTRKKEKENEHQGPGDKGAGSPVEGGQCVVRKGRVETTLL